MPKDDKEDKGWLNDLTKKQKLVFGLASLMVVILIGVFAWLGITGRFKIGAVTEFKPTKTSVPYAFSSLSRNAQNVTPKVSIYQDYDNSTATSVTYQTICTTQYDASFDPTAVTSNRRFVIKAFDANGGSKGTYAQDPCQPKSKEFSHVSPYVGGGFIQPITINTTGVTKLTIEDQKFASAGTRNGQEPDIIGDIEIVGSDENIKIFSANSKAVASRVPTADEAVLYSSENYGGAAFPVAADTPDLTGIPFNDLTHAAALGTNIESVTVCTGKNYTEDCATYTDQTPSITASGLLSGISSVKIKKKAGGGGATVQQYYIKAVSSGTIYDADDNANPPEGTGVKATVNSGSTAILHVKIQGATEATVVSGSTLPVIRPTTLTAADGVIDADVYITSGLNNIGVTFPFTLRYKSEGSDSFTTFTRNINITVTSPLTITPTTATIKVNELKKLFTVRGLANNDGRNAYSKNVDIAKVSGFWAEAGGDNTKATIDVTGIKEGTATIVVTSAGRTAEATVTVAGTLDPCTSCTSDQECINGKCVNHVVINSFTADPKIIDLGKESTLSWSTTYATDCEIDHGVGGVAVNGSTVVKPTITTTYTLTCGNGGTYKDKEQETVEVRNPNVCADGESVFDAVQSLWLLRTLSSNALTNDSTLESYLGDYVLSYYFDGFNKSYGESKNGKAGDFIGQGFWLKNKTGYDYLCLAISGTAKDSVETTLPHKGLGIVGNPLGGAISLKNNVAFKFSSTGDTWVSWDKAFNDGLLKAAFIWDNPTNSYLSFTNLSRYGDFAKYGYQTFSNMQDNLGPNEGIWIAPKSTETVTVRITK